ncbi:uncharacterized protein HaLaN_18023 [Haematococcus lacustris]|uniref:Uncharacterized protein n=1 Tax=Haematococcus lacustris TaxID=44745 RepID=A0A699ZDZ2_HAELA|nr:uncharacterized protein HaLaN_18023 [Haematococcus lacustris]
MVPLWMGLLNAFSGGVFLAAGLMHLIPHCQEAQQAVDLSRWGLPAEYPLYLLLVTLGYLLVLMVERVVFEGHSHGGHSHTHDHERAHIHSPLKHHSSDSEESNHSSGHTLSGHPRPKDVSAVPRRKKRAKADAEASAAGADGIAAGTMSCTEPGGLAAPAGSCASPLDQGPDTPALLGGKEAHLAHSAPTFRPLAGLTLLTGMTVHTALECLALGIITNHASFMALLVAIASHKAISALALSSRFVREGASTHQVGASCQAGRPHHLPEPAVQQSSDSQWFTVRVRSSCAAHAVHHALPSPTLRVLQPAGVPRTQWNAICKATHALCKGLLPGCVVSSSGAA